MSSSSARISVKKGTGRGKGRRGKEMRLMKLKSQMPELVLEFLEGSSELDEEMKKENTSPEEVINALGRVISGKATSTKKTPLRKKKVGQRRIDKAAAKRFIFHALAQCGVKIDREMLHGPKAVKSKKDKDKKKAAWAVEARDKQAAALTAGSRKVRRCGNCTRPLAIDTPMKVFLCLRCGGEGRIRVFRRPTPPPTSNSSMKEEEANEEMKLKTMDDDGDEVEQEEEEMEQEGGGGEWSQFIAKEEEEEGKAKKMQDDNKQDNEHLEGEEKQTRPPGMLA
eukprot:jgi/Bigna1/130223/aug1.10_g4931